MTNKKRGFTLIETLISLALLAVIAVFLLPSLVSIYDYGFKAKEDTKIIYALEKTIEEEKANIHSHSDIVPIKEIREDGRVINVEVKAYKDNPNLFIIKARSGKYDLEVIEAR